MSGLFVNPGAKASRNMRLRTIEWRLLRMMRLKSVRVSYAGDGHETFKAEF